MLESGQDILTRTENTPSKIVISVAGLLGSFGGPQTGLVSLHTFSASPHVCVYVCVCTCVCVRVCVCVHTQTRTHRHVHTQTHEHPLSALRTKLLQMYSTGLICINIYGVFHNVSRVPDSRGVVTHVRSYPVKYVSR